MIIVGGGPAGYTAALYTARANLEPLVFEGFQWGGQLQNTTDVENYPGYPEGIMGPEMMSQFRAQAERFGTRFVTDDVDRVELSDGGVQRVFLGDEEHLAKTVILAMGAEPRRLGVPGEIELGGRGVSTCGVCDGAFFKDQKVIVIGGGDSAMEDSIFISKYASELTDRQPPRRVPRLEDHVRARRASRRNIDFKTPFVAGGVRRRRRRQARPASGCATPRPASSEEIEADGAFVAIGHIPKSEIVAGQVDTDEDGYIVTEPGSTRTNLAGVFAVGDVVDHTYRQAVTAAGTGCMGALDAEWYLRDTPPSPEAHWMPGGEPAEIAPTGPPTQVRSVSWTAATAPISTPSSTSISRRGRRLRGVPGRWGCSGCICGCARAAATSAAATTRYGKHATAHHNETGHPIIRSAEPGEDWSWCYVDELMFELRSEGPARRRRRAARQVFEQRDGAVGADQVGELEWAERPVEAEPHRGVHVRGGADLLFEGEGRLVGDLGDEAGEDLGGGGVDLRQLVGVEGRRRDAQLGVGLAARALAVLVEAVPALAAQPAFRDQAFLDRAGAPALRLAALRVEGAGDAEVDVEPDQVDQLERAHAEAAAEPADAVDRRRVGDPVAEHPQRLQREGAGEAIGDEAGAVLGADRRASHPLADLGRSPPARCSAESAVATTSTSFISAGGLKKCMPTTRSGSGTPAAISVTGSEEVLVARIASGPQTLAASDREQLALQLEVLGRRLDHQVAAGEVVELGDGAQAAARRLGVVLAPPAALGALRQRRAHPLASRPRARRESGSWSRVS